MTILPTGKFMKFSFKKKLIILVLITASLVYWTYSSFDEKIALFFWKKFFSPNLVSPLFVSDAPISFEIGRHYFRSAHYDLGRAKSFFDRTLVLEEDFKEANLQLARIKFIEGDFHNALIFINKEITLYPESAKAYYVRALIYGYIGLLDLAEKDFIKFLGFVPESWAARNDLAWVYFQKGDFKNAVAIAEEGLGIVPNNPWLNNAKGISLMNLGDKEGAKKHLKSALEGFNKLAPQEWGLAYPGNDPRLYHLGLKSVRSSVETNLLLLDQKPISTSPH